MSAAAKLVVRQALGLSSRVKNCLLFVEDHHLAYVCGHQLVVLNTETREQNFIPCTSTYQHQSLGITAVAACPGKKLIAVAEKVDPTAIVTFYDSKTLRRKKLLAYPELGSKEIKCLVFSDDGKMLLMQGGAPDWTLVLWHVEKTTKVLCSVKVAGSEENTIHKVSFCPWDPTVILVIGKSVLKLYRFVEGQLRTMTITVRRDSANFISYCWLSDEIFVVGTEAGELLMIENFEFRGHISTTKNDSEELYPATCLQTTSRGFIFGSLHGELKLFEKKDDIKEKYQLEDTIFIPGDHGNILELVLGSDDLLICGTDRHQLLSCSLTNLNNVKEGTSTFEHVFAPHHLPNQKGESEITGIDVALWKQIVVTCGKDKTVRVWNPSDRKVELMKEFDEEPLGLSVHPSGIYCAVIFPDKIRLLTLLLEEIYISREIAARQVSYIKFSRGGHYIASANGSNLQIYSTYTGASIATMRGHNNRIKSVCWLNYDSQVMTIGTEGAVYYWDIFPTAKKSEHYPGTIPISAGAGPSDGASVYIATHDKLIKELNFSRANDLVLAANSSVAAVVNGTNTTTNNNNNNNANSSNTTTNTTTALTNLSTALHSSTDGIVVKVAKTIDAPGFIDTMIFEETRRILLMGTTHEEHPCGIAVTLTSPTLGGGPMGSTTALVEMNLIHSGAITALCVSYDGTTVYSGDAHGCLVVSEFEHAVAFTTGSGAGSSNNTTSTGMKSPAAASKARDGVIAFEFIEEVVIHKQELEHRKAQIQQLTLAVEELQKNNEHQMRLKELEHKDRLREITDKFVVQLKAEKMKYDELEAERQAIEKEFGRKVKALEGKHIDELKAIEFKYKTKYNAEENRHKQLTEETEEAHRRWNDENQVLVQSHQQYLQELTADYERKLMMEQTQQKEIQVEKEKLQV